MGLYGKRQRSPVKIGQGCKISGANLLNDSVSYDSHNFNFVFVIHVMNKVQTHNTFEGHYTKFQNKAL